MTEDDYWDRMYEYAEEGRRDDAVVEEGDPACDHENLEEGVPLEGPAYNGSFAVGDVCPDCGFSVETGRDSVL